MDDLNEHYDSISDPQGCPIGARILLAFEIVITILINVFIKLFPEVRSRWWLVRQFEFGYFAGIVGKNIMLTVRINEIFINSACISSAFSVVYADYKKSYERAYPKST